MNRACKAIAENKPIGHELLYKLQTFQVTSLSIVSGISSYKVFLESSANPKFVMTTPLHQVEFSYGNESNSTKAQSIRRAYRVGSFDSLRLAEDHRQIYYYIQDENIVFAAPSTLDIWNVANAATLRINHYIYTTITDFPDQLEEYLLKELVGLIQNEIGRIQKDEAHR